MKSLHVLSLFFILTVLSSCESKTFLRSKKKLDKDLQGYWSPISGTSIYGTQANDQNILWHFSDGKVFIIKVDNNGNDIQIDKGFYSIDTKIDSDFLTISDLSSHEYLSYGFNIKWDIYELYNNNLNISGKPNNSGKIQIEFSKVEH